MTKLEFSNHFYLIFSAIGFNNNETIVPIEERIEEIKHIANIVRISCQGKTNTTG
jgi:hypothetical protein